MSVWWTENTNEPEGKKTKKGSLFAVIPCAKSVNIVIGLHQAGDLLRRHRWNHWEI